MFLWNLQLTIYPCLLRDAHILNPPTYVNIIMMIMYLYSKIRKCDTINIIGDVGFCHKYILTVLPLLCGEACTYLQINLCTCTVCTGDVYVYTAIYIF